MQNYLILFSLALGCFFAFSVTSTNGFQTSLRSDSSEDENNWELVTGKKIRSNEDLTIAESQQVAAVATFDLMPAAGGTEIRDNYKGMHHI